MSESEQTAIQNVAVIGAGTMGSGIALVIAAAGVPVTVIDQNNVLIDRGRKRIETDTQRMVKAEKLTDDDAAQLLARTTFAADDDFAG